MLVSSKTLELAMGRVLRQRSARAGQCFRYAELERDWRATGLRLEDLRDVARELLERGLLECPELGGELEFELTTAGYHYFFEPAPPFASLIAGPGDVQRLEQAQRRSREHFAAAPQRRATDPVIG